MTRKETGGYITLYLAITLGVMLSLIFTLIEGVRRQTIRLETEGVMDIGLMSVFGEYHRQLLEQYDLFFIDTTYGEGEPSIEKTQEHLQFYMNENFQKEAAAFPLFRDLTALRCDNVTLTAYMRASDNQGEVLKEQIVEYMKGRKGITLAEAVAENLNLIKSNGLDSRDVEGEWDEVQAEIDRQIDEERRRLAAEQEEVELSIDNPADQVRQTRGNGILQIALPEGKTVSSTLIHPEYYYSHRQPLLGNGQINRETSVVEQAVGRAFLQEYLFEKCGYYQKPLEKGVLTYQLEYILKGQSRDDENLRLVLQDILHIRQAANIAFLFSSQDRQAQAEMVSSIICSAILMPELIELVKLSILYAWSYAESVKDIRILLDGRKVALFKDDHSWNTSLGQLINYRASLGDYKHTDQGLDYKDYLEMFLYMKGEEAILEGFMDICEMDIRLTEGNENFRIDGCLGALQARANVSSGYGYGYEITRSFYY